MTFPLAATAGSGVDALHAALDRAGFCFLDAVQMRPLLQAQGALSDWGAFADSWNTLAMDNHMADRGRYRRRRHAVFVTARDGDIRRLEHQPHYQSLEYNALNGGIARWFEPVSAAAGEGASLRVILTFCRDLFGALAPSVSGWRIEVHQFRIEARAGEPGLPTPEGVHRDGVDYVLVLMIGRHNIASGTTTIHLPDGTSLGQFTLRQPFDAALVDDARVCHGVTPVEPIDPARPAYRDVLVVTFKAQAPRVARR
ncbi:2OG-Fe dioxygenase family protein [Tahibacter amnicola]|uniref:2OG-Fe dioxygenase family protein n=1 Tax=Tahibacter amnicola TaxID=2976241 RepID=A0ABY6BH91_9GAMM|nr:2OG-Fe dioxygenase family protein [Tahibacter amnicola]UXI67976.1 2OG-Fe dioxygenase family protein [Tahibacter amnicola]